MKYTHQNSNIRNSVTNKPYVWHVNTFHLQVRACVTVVSLIIRESVDSYVGMAPTRPLRNTKQKPPNLC